MSDHLNPLALLDIQGQPYEIGQQLGQFGAAAVHDHLLNTAAWASVTAHRADPRVLEMRRRVEAQYSHVWAELNGLADGLALGAWERPFHLPSG